MLILDSNDHMIKSITKMLVNKFDMKDISVADVILGIKTSKRSNRLILFQSYYIEKILKKFSKDNNIIVKTQINTSVYMSKNKGNEINQLEYS